MSEGSDETTERDGDAATVESIALETRDGGCFLPVKAQPGAGKNELRGVRDGALKVCVTQIAEKGKANKAFVELLAKALKVSKSRITLTAGELSTQKTFFIAEIDADELREKISAALAKGKR